MTDTRDALAAFFLGNEPFGDFGIARLADYSWPIHDTFRAVYPDLPAGDGYPQNVELKRALTRSWADASPDQRIELVHMIVAVWGGIRGNRPMKLLVYRDLAMNPPSELPFAGVASYSKVLSIVAPDDYAIFDARVAAALNAIMMMARPEKALLFPYLPSRNVAIGRFMAAHPVAAAAAGVAGWSVVPRSQAYPTYLEVLKSVLSALPAGTVLRDLEMCLFSQAPRLVLEAGKG